MVLDMPWADGIVLTAKAKERITEQSNYQRWISGYDKEMSFSDFERKLNPNVKDNKTDGPHRAEDTRTSAEILLQVRKILEMRIE